jgi:hypothetical protein
MDRVDRKFEAYCRLLKRGDSASYPTKHYSNMITDVVVEVTYCDIILLRKIDDGASRKMYVGFEYTYKVFQNEPTVDSRIKLELLGL